MSKKNLCGFRLPGLFILFALTLFFCGTGWTQPAEPYRFDLDEDALSGPVDFSDLNHPLGPDARLLIKNGHFYRIGADLAPHTDDDSRVRLFGANLSFAANFPSQKQAPLIAKRLRKLGFNAVRLHHLDSAPSTETDPPRSLLTPDPYPSFNKEALSRLRFFIQALAKEGLYTNLNLHVGYRFKESDGIPAYDETGMRRPNATPVKVFEPALIEKQKIFAIRLIDELGLKQAPHLAMVEISNESSLLAAWHRKEWLDAIPGDYYNTLTAQWHGWLEQRYGTPETACQHWANCPGAHWPRLPEPGHASTAAATALEDLKQRIDKKLTAWSVSWRASSLPSPASPWLADFQLFLAETDRRYFSTLRTVIQQHVGWPVPVTGSQMSYGGTLNLVSHQTMDYLDDHFYVDHPEFMQGFSEPRNWRVWDVSLTAKTMEEHLLKKAYRRALNKPFVISEFNHPFPSRQGAEVVPITAAFASLQDWDGLFFYDYTNHYHDTNAPSSFALRGDWGKYANIGQSARLFREFLIPALAPLRTISLSASSIALFNTKDEEASLLAYLQRQGGYTPQETWTRRIGLQLSQDTDISQQLEGEAETDPSVHYAASAKQLRINTADVQGWFGASLAAGQRAAPAGLRVSTEQGQAVSVLVTSLDGQPIAHAKRLLISTGSATVGSQPGAIPARPKQWIRHPAGNSSWTLEPDPQHADLPSGSRYATGPAWVFRTPMQLQLPSAHQLRAVYPLDPTGQRRPPLPDPRITQTNGVVSIDLQQTENEASLWYELVLQ